jgi:hypothetical protein
MTQQPAAGPLPPSQPSPAYPPYPPAVPPPPPAGRWEPERIDPLPGTEFGLVHLRVVPITSGLAIGSLVAGIGAILVSTLVICFGFTGSTADWGGWVSGAFTLLSVAIGGGAAAVGGVARRQIRQSVGTGRVRFVGGGMAVAGIVCGSTGVGIALLGLVLALMLQL